MSLIKEPTNEPFPLHLAAPISNKRMQACASANVNGVHAAVNYITIRHVQPIPEVQANSVTTPGYGGFNSKTNSIFNPTVTTASKMTSFDLDPGTFLVPDAVCASSNLWFYPPSQFGHPVLPHGDLNRSGYYGISNAAKQASK